MVLRTRPDGGTDIEVLHGDVVVGTGQSEHAPPFSWQHGGTALCLGFDQGFPVSDQYKPPFPWNGQLDCVIVEAPLRPAPTVEDVPGLPQLRLMGALM